MLFGSSFINLPAAENSAHQRNPASHTPCRPVQFWVSQANHWCEYCKVWLKDTAQSRAVHEKGIKHQENVAKRE